MTSQVRPAGGGVVRPLGGLLALAALALAVAAAGLPAPEQERKGPVKDGRTEDEDDGKGPVKNVKDKPTPEDDDAARPLPVRALYKELSVAHDRVVLLAGDKKELRVPPLPLRAPDRLTETVKRPVFDAAGKPSRDPITLSPDGVKSVEPYEAVVLKKVKEFLLKEDLDPGERQAAAENVLTAALRFHESAHERGLRQGDGWDATEKGLRDQLFAVLVERLDGLAQKRSWDEAFALAARLVRSYAGDRPQRLAGPLEGLLARVEFQEKLQASLRLPEPLLRAVRDRLPEPAARALKDPPPKPEQIDQVYQHLTRLVKGATDQKGVQELRRRLQGRAQELFDQARAAPDPSDKQALLRQAQEMAPDLKGLAEELGKITEQYKVLRVGVRHRPEYFSPAWAATDSERRAVELLFESLVRYGPDERGVWRYRTGLAEGRPQLVPGGRRFQMPDNALWSNGDPIDPGDVRETVALLRQGKGQGLPKPWGELLNPVVLAGGDRTQLDLTLQRGFVEPLALMQFKVLPSASAQVVESKAFAEEPVCSGPFKVGKAGAEQGGPTRSLVPNLNYGGRGGHRPPPFQEVLFIEYKDPVEDFKDLKQPMHLALDLTADEAAQLREQADKLRLKVPLPDELPPNRRVYFLLINPAKNKALESAALRRAIAYSIYREEILDECFRGKPPDPRLHKALNGPYPVGCWACKPELHSKSDKKSLDPYDPDAARAAFQAFKEQGGERVQAKVKYPKGDAQLADAMQRLCGQMNRTLPKEVQLTPEECDVRALKKAVESGDYELAYWHYDFPDDTYWLGPLLGPNGLTRFQSGKTADLVGEATGVREFAQVRDYARRIHAAVLTEEMPLIPLWQLDPLLAISKAVEAPPFDPRRVFGDIDRGGWRVRN